MIKRRPRIAGMVMKWPPGARSQVRGRVPDSARGGGGGGGDDVGAAGRAVSGASPAGADCGSVVSALPVLSPG